MAEFDFKQYMGRVNRETRTVKVRMLSHGTELARLADDLDAASTAAERKKVQTRIDELRAEEADATVEFTVRALTSPEQVEASTAPSELEAQARTMAYAAVEPTLSVETARQMLETLPAAEGSKIWQTARQIDLASMVAPDFSPKG